MKKLIYYTTEKDGLVCFDAQSRKHESIIQNRTFEDFGQQFWVHGDYIYFSDNTYQIHAYSIKTGNHSLINQSRASNMQVVDNYVLFRNMDDGISVQAMPIQDISGSLNSYSLPHVLTLLEKGICCYGKHPWRNGEFVIYYFNKSI